MHRPTAGMVSQSGSDFTAAMRENLCAMGTESSRRRPKTVECPRVLPEQDSTSLGKQARAPPAAAEPARHPDPRRGDNRVGPVDLRLRRTPPASPLDERCERKRPPTREVGVPHTRSDRPTLAPSAPSTATRAQTPPTATPSEHPRGSLPPSPSAYFFFAGFSGALAFDAFLAPDPHAIVIPPLRTRGT